MSGTVDSVTVRFDDGLELTTQDALTCSEVQRIILAEVAREIRKRKGPEETPDAQCR
jgi:hypothetical protein